MKKLLGILLLIILSAQLTYSFSGSGSGTVGDPYQITSVSQLQEMQNARTSHYILMNDIDASATSSWNSGAGFVPVGWYYNASSFSGSLDGQGYTISDLYINRTPRYTGLFGFLSGATVKNVNLKDVDISGRTTTGGIAGYSYSYSTVENCYISGNISGSTQTGGITGMNTRSKVLKSFVTGSITSSGGWCGGITGSNYLNSQINECSSTATVNCPSKNLIGGVAGNNESGSKIYNSFNWGYVRGSTYVGGVCGYNKSGAGIYNTYSKGQVVGGGYTGGLCGRNQGTISYSYWDTQTSGRSSSSGGTGKTTVEMKQLATFTNWNFNTIWYMETDGHAYPVLHSYRAHQPTIPTLTEWAAIFMGVLLAGFGAFFIFRRMG